MHDSGKNLLVNDFLRANEPITDQPPTIPETEASIPEAAARMNVVVRNRLSENLSGKNDLLPDQG